MRNAFFFLFLFSGFTLFAVTDPLLSQTINLSTRQEVTAIGFRNSQDTCVNPPPGMVAWWPLDEISGTTVTDIVNGFNGTTQPGPIGGSTGPGPTPTLPSSFPPGMVGSSLFFGSTRHIRVPHNPNLDPDTGSFAVDFWFIWGGGSGPIIQKMLPTGEGWGIFLVQSSSNPGTANVEVRWRFASGTAMPVAALGITSNRWYHLYAGIIRGGGTGGDYSSFLLFDPQLGIQYQTGPGVVPGIIAPTETVSTAADLIIGGDGVSPGPQIAIDEIEIFGRTLSIQEIVALEFSGKAGKCKPTCVPPPQGMVGWWPLDETSSPANDLAGVNNAGTWMNGPTPVAGKVAGALHFDGVDDHVRVPDHAELNVGKGNFTLDAWVRTGSSDLVLLVDKRSGPTPQGYSLFLYNGQLGFQMANGVGGSGCAPTPTPGYACVNYVAPPSSPSVADGQWHHVAAVVDRNDTTSGVRLYVDGALVFTGIPMVAPFPDDLDNTSDLYLGMRTPGMGGGGFLPGDLDEVELIKRALDSTEIRSIWAAGSLGKCKPTTGSIQGYKFNDLNGNCVKDSLEQGLPGWTINLSGSGLSLSTTTDSLGQYSFGSVPAGTYTVSEVPQSGWTQTCPAGGTYTVNLSAGQQVTAINFGNRRDTCIAPPQGMVGWWPLDETSSPANDLAGVNNTGTWINNPTPVAGKVGGALYFFPPNYVEVSPHPELDLGTGDFSIDAWVRPVDCSHGPAHILSPIVDKFNGTNGFSFYLDQPNVGVANLYLNINGSTFTSSGTIPTLGSSTWSHIAVTVKRGVSGPGVGTFYINGSPAGTFTPPLGTVTNTVPLWIGEIRVPGAGRCEIAIDELEIFNRALDSTEIHSIWAAGSLGKCKQPPSPPETGKNHYKSWRIEPVPVDTFALTQDQFTLQQLRLSAVVGISNPVRKIINSPVRSDTFDIMRPDDHLTVYRAEGKPIAVQVEYENQFEHTKVFLDSVKYLLVPAQKVPHAPPARLDHYTAYRIRNPISFASRCELQDQFDQLDKTSEFIDTLSQAYFLTPTRKNKEPVYDTLTHYVAYEIHPVRRTSQPWWSFTDQFGNYRLFVLDSKYLLVPTKKLSFVTGVSEEGAIPAGFALLQSYPNPFNPTTTIEYHVPVSGFVKLSVFDILGREIAVLVDGNVQAGKHKVTFDASGFAAGVYFYRMQAGKFQETRKLILLK